MPTLQNWNLPPELEAERQALQAEHADLEREYLQMQTDPHTRDGHEAHSARLRAHIARLNAFVQRLSHEREDDTAIT